MDEHGRGRSPIDKHGRNIPWGTDGTIFEGIEREPVELTREAVEAVTFEPGKRNWAEGSDPRLACMMYTMVRLWTSAVLVAGQNRWEFQVSHDYSRTTRFGDELPGMFDFEGRKVVWHFTDVCVDSPHVVEHRIGGLDGKRRVELTTRNSFASREEQEIVLLLLEKALNGMNYFGGPERYDRVYIDFDPVVEMKLKAGAFIEG